MYWMYTRKKPILDWSGFLALIKSRWLRIAPAYYCVVIVCAVGYWLFEGKLPWFRLLAHLLFLNGVLPGAEALAAPFWSLTTEWQFYLALPLFCWIAYRWSFSMATLLAAGFCVVSRAYFYLRAPHLVGTFEILLPFRLVEFVWGIGVAYLFSKRIPPPRFVRGLAGILIGLGIAYLGRFLRVTEVVRSAGQLGPLAKSLAEPVMSLGFAAILWSAVSSPSLLSSGLAGKAITAVGRWSYSLYLWHWYPCLWISHRVIARIGSNSISQYLALLISMAVLVPVSWLSYKALEEPYFRRKHHA
jgi:peptidoglycan/LPS O-acetylase OafA/YrhL